MGNTDLAVRIATILDSTGLKKADKAIGGLESSAKKLGKTLGIALSTAAVVSFGRAAVKAFSEDEAAAVQLNNAIKNLGLSFSQGAITQFISDLEKTSGVLDDQLRPAMQSILTTTGNFAKSQEILTLAIETSRATGIDLMTVVQDLNNAYVGNTKGLKKYNLGLSQTQLKSMSFLDVQKKLNKQFSGSNAAYLETYAGKMDVLRVASANASEAIGESLVNALMTLSGSTSAEGLGRFIDKVTGYLTGLIDSVSFFVYSIQWLMNPKNWLRSGKNGENPIQADYDKMKAQRAAAAASPYDAGNNAVTGYKRDRAAAIQAEKDAAKRAKALVDAQKKNTAELKKQALAKKQNSLFDMEQIQIIAALKGNISKEEELRLKLQLALITGNEDQAKKLSDQLADSIDKTGKLKLYINTLPEAPNPFAAWDTFLDGVIAKARLAASIGGSGSSQRENLPSLSPTVASLVTGAVTGSAGSTSAGDVYITVQGSVLSEQDLVDAVQSGLNYNALAGKRSDIGRIAGMFG